MSIRCSKGTFDYFWRWIRLWTRPTVIQTWRHRHCLSMVLFKQIKGDIAQGIALANCLPRVSDSVVPFVGALLGAEQGIASVSEGWITRLGAISGTFVPQAAGSDLTQLATQLMDLAQGRGDDIENHLDQT